MMILDSGLLFFGPPCMLCNSLALRYVLIQNFCCLCRNINVAMVTSAEKSKVRKRRSSSADDEVNEPLNTDQQSQIQPSELSLRKQKKKAKCT